jgi:hypothetical protein
VRGAFAPTNSKSPCREYDCSDQIDAYHQPLHSPGHRVRARHRFRRKLLYDEWHSSEQSMGRYCCGLRMAGIDSRLTTCGQCHRSIHGAAWSSRRLQRPVQPSGPAASGTDSGWLTYLTSLFFVRYHDQRTLLTIAYDDRSAEWVPRLFYHVSISRGSLTSSPT